MNQGQQEQPARIAGCGGSPVRNPSPRENLEPQVAQEMPRYRCHKEVWALKIKAIDWNSDILGSDGTITPMEAGYAPFRVDGAYIDKHNPKVGGYYVVYKDGYKSFSPAKAFEDGYTLIK